MKKLFGMIAIVLLFSSVVFAGTRLLNETKVEGEDGVLKFAVRTICTDGYKFVVVRSVDMRGKHVSGGITAGLAITQSYENQNGKAVPARC